MTESPSVSLLLFTVHNGMPDPKNDIRGFLMVFLSPCRETILVSRLGLEHFLPNHTHSTIHQSSYHRRSLVLDSECPNINDVWRSMWTYSRKNIKMFWSLQSKLLFADGWCLWEWNSKSQTDNNFLELLFVVLLSLNNLCPWNAHTCGWILRFIEYSLVWPALLYRCGFSV